MSNICECDKQKISSKQDFIYYLCENCGKIIKRKEDMCDYVDKKSYCTLAASKGYSYLCRVKGKFKECKNGKHDN